MSTEPHDEIRARRTDAAFAGIAASVPAAIREMCDHEGTERVTRTAHGYLGDAPAGTVETLCADCGAEVEPPVPPVDDPRHPAARMTLNAWANGPRPGEGE